MWCNFKFEGVLLRSDSRHNDRVDSIWASATKQAVMTVVQWHKIKLLEVSVQGPSKGPHNLTSTGPHLSEIRHWLWSVRDYRIFFYSNAVHLGCVWKLAFSLRMWGSTCMITSVLLWGDILVHKVGLAHHLLLKGRTGMGGQVFVLLGCRICLFLWCFCWVLEVFRWYGFGGVLVMEVFWWWRCSGGVVFEVFRWCGVGGVLVEEMFRWCGVRGVPVVWCWRCSGGVVLEGFRGCVVLGFP